MFVKFLGNLSNPDHFGAVRGRLGALLEAFLEPRNLRNSALFRFRGGPAQKLTFFLDQSEHMFTKLLQSFSGTRKTTSFGGSGGVLGGSWGVLGASRGGLAEVLGESRGVLGPLGRDSEKCNKTS